MGGLLLSHEHYELALKMLSIYGLQWSHPHPSWSPRGDYVLYTSDSIGCPQIYLVEK